MTEATPPPKDIFFFSDQCVHCKEASIYVDKNIGNYVKVNIDTHEVPDFLDRVPALLTSEKKVLYEDELFEYLTQNKDAEPFMVHEMNGLSDRYSYMDETNTVLNHSFDFLNSPTKIITPAETDASKIINYEEVLAKRDNDLKNNMGL
jgi:glutaredoxin